MGAAICLRRRREIGAAATGQELSLGIEHARLGGGELPAHRDDLTADGEIARHGGGVIIDAQVDGRYASAGLLDHRPVGAEVDEGGEHAAMRIAPIGVHNPFLAPGRLELDAVLFDCYDLEAKPLMIGCAGDHLLHALDRELSSHRILLLYLVVVRRVELRA
jgi:hypothetical protein